MPGTYPEDQQLSMWVKYQRDAKRRGRLKAWQVRLPRGPAGAPAFLYRCLCPNNARIPFLNKWV